MLFILFLLYAFHFGSDCSHHERQSGYVHVCMHRIHHQLIIFLQNLLISYSVLIVHTWDFIMKGGRKFLLGYDDTTSYTFTCIDSNSLLDYHWFHPWFAYRFIIWTCYWFKHYFKFVLEFWFRF